VLSNTNRKDLLKLKSIIENETRSTADVQIADRICAGFIFESVETVCRREMDTNVTDLWLMDNAWRIFRTVATTDSAKKNS
jgi:hypothetical protein